MAFFGCMSMKSIMIPPSVTSIGNLLLSYGDNTVVCGEKGSYAETYANQNNITFASEFTNISSISLRNSLITIVGETVELDVCSVLGQGDITYAVYYKKASDTKWTTKQNFSANTQVTIKPAKAADYQICVKAKDSTGKIVKKYIDLKVEPKLSNDSTLSAENIVIGQKITVNCLASGGSSKYGYESQVVYKQASQTKWTTAQPFDSNTSVTFKPAKATTYNVCVKVRDLMGTVIKKYFTVNVSEKLKNTSSLSSEKIKLGEKLTANCSAQGGIGKYQYQAVYKQTSQTAWKTAQAFSENDTIVFKPAKATSYDVCVKAKDESGTVVKKFFKVTVE